MRFYLFTAVLFIYTLTTFSQGVGVNDDGTMPVAGAILDVKSTTGGMLIPRMTTAQRNAISSKPHSLLIYQTDGDSGFYYYHQPNDQWYPFLSGGAADNSGWATKGNSGTVAGTNFIGTIDSIDWVIKTNNNEKMRVTGNGNVGIGTNTPSSKLDIQRSIAAGAGAGTAAIKAYNSNYSQVVVPADVRTGIATVGHWDNTANPGIFHGTGLFSKVPSGGHLSHTSAAIFEREEIGAPNLRRVYFMGSDTGFTYVSALFPYMIAIDKSNEEVDFIVQGDGNIGVGTATPEYDLDVDGTAITEILRIEDPDDGNNNRLILNAESSQGVIKAQNSIHVILDSDNNNADTREFTVMKNATDFGSASELFRIEEGGNVGIGTTSPNYSLEVNGTIASTTGVVRSHADGSSAVVYTLSYRNAINHNKLLAYGARGSASSPAVLSSSDAMLEINGFGHNGTTFNSYESARIFLSADGTHDASNAPGKITFYTTSAGSGTSAERMRIDKNGNVGIGNTSLDQKLHVLGDAILEDTGPILYLKDNNSTVGSNGHQNHVRFIDQNDATTGIVGFSGSGQGMSIQNTNSSAGNIQFSTGGLTNAVMFHHGGNVGIGTGTATPTQKLVVAGNIVPSATNNNDLGTSSLRWRTIYSNNALNTSDKRLKKDVEHLNYGIQEVMKLSPVTFRWKNDDSYLKIGFIAQDLQKIIPEVVNIGDDKNQTLGVYYTDIIPVLTKAIQEQQQIIDELKFKENTAATTIKNQGKKIEDLTTEIEAIKAILNQTGEK